MSPLAITWIIKSLTFQITTCNMLQNPIDNVLHKGKNKGKICLIL
jgi:hypothetical protein